LLWIVKLLWVIIVRSAVSDFRSCRIRVIILVNVIASVDEVIVLIDEILSEFLNIRSMYISVWRIDRCSCWSLGELILVDHGH